MATKPRHFLYSLHSIVIESFCHFGTFHHSNRVISLFSKSQPIFPHLLYSLLLFYLFISLHFFIFHFILPLLNSPNTIFLNLRAKKFCLHYYGMKGVHHNRFVLKWQHLKVTSWHHILLAEILPFFCTHDSLLSVHVYK